MIITSNEKGNIILGELQVRDSNELREFKNGLLQVRSDLKNYKVSKQENLGGFCSLLDTGYTRRGDALVHQYITDSDGDDCTYTRETIECSYLNSILLFTSLLGELDASHYNYIAQQFVANGIIKYAPIDKIWKPCSKGIINSVFAEMDKKNTNDFRKLMMLDLKAFRFALLQGIISYDQKEEVIVSRKVDKPMFGAFNSQELGINNALLLGDYSIFEKHSRIKRKNG